MDNKGVIQEQLRMDLASEFKRRIRGDTANRDLYYALENLDETIRPAIESILMALILPVTYVIGEKLEEIDNRLKKLEESSGGAKFSV